MAELGPQLDERREKLADLRQRLSGHWQVPAFALAILALLGSALLAVVPRQEKVTAEQLMQQAEQALADKRYAAADQLTEELLRSYPEQAAADVRFHRLQAACAFELAMAANDDVSRRNWLNKARAAHAAALPLERGRLPISTLERMGRIAMELGEYQEAVDHFDRALEQGPPQLVSLALLRVEALRSLPETKSDVLLKDIAGATAEVMKRLADLDRDLAATSVEAASSRQRIQARVLELKNDLTRLAIVEADLLGREGQHDRAEQNLLRLLKEHQPKDNPSRQLLLAVAKAQGGQGKWTVALDTLNRILDLSSGAATESADARAHLMKGQAYYQMLNYDAAIEQFALAAELFPDSPEGLAARVGLAETLLAVEDIDRAQEVLAEVVPQIRGRRLREGQPLIDVSAVRQMLRAQTEMSLLRRRVDDALKFVSLEEAIVAEPQRDVLVRKAAVLEQVAEVRAAEALKAQPGSAEAVNLRLAAERAWRQAGDIFMAVAETFDATTQYEYGHSCWAASRAYLKAGAHERSAAVLKQFIAEQPLDSRVPQARLDLAGEYQVLGQWQKAIDTYRTLVEESPSSLAGFEGRYRLAVALIRGGPEHYDQAEEVLLGIVERSEQVLPDSLWYRRSLFELGRLMHLRDRHDEALLRLSEFVQRYPRDEQALSAEYLMAESLRQQGLAALERSRTAAELLERRAAAEIAQEKLSASVAEMRRLIAVYDRLPAPELTAMAAGEVRSLLFDLADTLSQLGRQDEAIAVYDQIVVRYQTSPAAMSAYSRLAAEYRRTNRRDQLMAVLERARWTLKKIPDEAFTAEPGMSRDFWEYWLETMQL